MTISNFTKDKKQQIKKKDFQKILLKCLKVQKIEKSLKAQ